MYFSFIISNKRDKDLDDIGEHWYWCARYLSEPLDLFCPFGYDPSITSAEAAEDAKHPLEESDKSKKQRKMVEKFEENSD